MDTVQLPPTRKDPKGFQQTQLAGDAVKVSLQDCLACSGCVTSAETVLLEHQSTGELMAALHSDKTVIVSVSPQSRASLGVLHKQSPTETAGKLAYFLKSLGAKLVLDTTSSRDIALLEAAQEFLARYTAKHPEVSSNQTSTPLGILGMPICHDARLVDLAGLPLSTLNFRVSVPTWTIVCIADEAECMDADLQDRRQSHAQAGPSESTSSAQLMPSSTSNSGQNTVASMQPASQPVARPSGQKHTSSSNHVQQSFSAEHRVLADVQHKAESSGSLPCGSEAQTTAQHDPGPLPMLASACPGWVCYAEKTHGSYILPFISTTKSPQVSLRPRSLPLLNPPAFALLFLHSQ